MSHYCPINEPQSQCKVITPDDTFKSEDYAGPYSSHKECVDQNIIFNRCLPYKCDNGKCIQDKDGIYYSNSSCEVLCEVGDDSKTKTFCEKLQKHAFDYIDIDLNCKDKNQQNLNVVLLIVIIWIGILLF